MSQRVGKLEVVSLHACAAYHGCSAIRQEGHVGARDVALHVRAHVITHIMRVDGSKYMYTIRARL